MENLHIPDNIKVHFAGAENITDATMLYEMGINYCLYTAFPFVDAKIRNKKSSDTLVPIFTAKNMKHVIQDSGLFTMLYGKYKNKASPSLVYKWYDALVEYTLEHGQNVVCVEVDAQSIIGDFETWKLRERIKNDLPNNRIINVFHLEDGIYGLDRLIEYSDYIAVGSGTPSNSSATMYEVSSYIKSKKPSCDIHLLGCTTFNTIKKCSFCTSCDSVTWLNARRFGTIGHQYHVSALDYKKIIPIIGEERFERLSKSSKETTVLSLCANIEWWKHKLVRMCGDQDFRWIYR